jgi:hypothetical protein
LTIKEFIESMVSIFNKRLTKNEANSYYRIIKDWDLSEDQLDLLFDRVVEQCRYFPRPNELREAVDELYPIEVKRFEGNAWEFIDCSDGTTRVRYTKEYLEWKKTKDRVHRRDPQKQMSQPQKGTPVVSFPQRLPFKS